MRTTARRLAAPVFALALFSSAALIFVLQPLFGRMVTPLLGGSPQVWNTSMAFFQAALLAGYLYAHVLARVADLRLQAAIHIGVLAAAWLVLPVQVSHALGAPSSEHPALWLVGVLTLSVGAPFAAASATAPLLQSWYTRTGRADSNDPYYLYAASNLGSFVGLLGYPILIEPTLGAHAQSLAWSAGYLGVGALIALTAALALAAHGETPKYRDAANTPAPTWRQRAFWIGAAAVPSALTLGVTLHISTDVASAPFLWVVPLALYLLTFVIAFARGGERWDQAVLFVHPIGLAVLVMSYYASGNWLGSVGGILIGFFVSALVCHQAVARARPSAERLTDFYLCLSLGGVLGGAFAALLAPVIFNNVYEYPLALAAACLLRPRMSNDTPRLEDASLAAAIAVSALAVLLGSYGALNGVLMLGALGAAAAMIATGWGGDARPMRLRYAALGIAALHAAAVIYVAFNAADVFTYEQGNGQKRLLIAEPWGPLLLATSLAVMLFAVHATVQRDRERVADLAHGGAMLSTVFVMMLVLMAERLNIEALTATSIGFCALALFLNRGRPLAMAAIVVASFVVVFLGDARGGQIITQERSFFGVLRTRVLPATNAENAPPERILMHGTTIHGAQIAAPGFTQQPLTYYNPHTALGEAILAGLLTGDRSNLALIGLGAGSTACLMRPEDSLTIFEIDPLVVRLSARPGGDFSYVPECQPHARIELGDARLQIAEEPDGAFDVIVVDAFSSDAIPAHLLTREAIALYLRKTSDRGIVVLHLSNRNLALVSEAARVAHALNAPTLYRDSERLETIYYLGGLGASVMILARSPQALAILPLASRADWRILEAPAGRAWTDDYINLPRAFWENLSGIKECRLHPDMRSCLPASPNPH